MEAFGPETDFSALIAQKRANLGLSAAEASRLAGISQSQWSRAEGGQYPLITLHTALRMLQALGLSIGLTRDNETQS